MSDDNRVGAPLAALSLQRTERTDSRERPYRQPVPGTAPRPGSTSRPACRSPARRLRSPSSAFPAGHCLPPSRPTASAAGPASGRDTPCCGGFFSKSCGRCFEFGTTGEVVLQQTREPMTDQAASRHRRPDGRAAAPAGRVPPHPPGPGSGLAAELPLRRDGRAAGSNASHTSPAGRLPMTHLPATRRKTCRFAVRSPCTKAGNIPQVSPAAHHFGRFPHLAGPVPVRERQVRPGAAAIVCEERQAHRARGGHLSRTLYVEFLAARGVVLFLFVGDDRSCRHSASAERGPFRSETSPAEGA